MSIVKNITSEDNLDWREIVINWEGMGDDVTEIKAGTPMDAEGNIANNGNCFGLMMGDVLRTRSRARVVISGPVDLDEAEANSGITLTDEAKAAMRDVWFPGKSGGGLPTGGAPYQQLVTDGEGNVKWADRLAYGDSRVVIEFNPGEWFVHVSDDIGELNATDGAELYFHFDDGSPDGSEGTCTLQAAGDLLSCQYCFIALTDNIDLGGIVLPKRGIYLYKTESSFVSSVANFVPPASDTDQPPEPIITWDGSTGEIKKLDEKFLPPVSGLIVKSSTSESTKKFKITVDDSGAITATEV